MSVQIEERQPGYFSVTALWPQGFGVRATLVLTDPDGETQTDVVEWVAPADQKLSDAVAQVVMTIDAVTHWRAVWLFNELVIEPASDDYSGEVILEQL